MSTIWFDVTSVLRWKRPAVGIIRIETECAKYALQHLSAKVRFCRFDIDKKYVAVSPELVRRSLLRIKNSRLVRSNKKMQKEAYSQGERKYWLKAMILQILTLLPKTIRTFLFNKIADFKGKPQIVDRSIDEERIAFTHSDVYISVGLDWQDKDLEYLYHIKRSSGFNILLCCHDIIPVKFPHLCSGDLASKFGRYFADLAWCADEILCVSRSSRKDLRTLLEKIGGPGVKTTLMRLGSDLVQPDAEDDGNMQTEVDGRFILFVSTIERRKNHETLYRAYTRLIDLGMENLPKLVFVGMKGWGISEFFGDLGLDPRINGQIKVLTEVSDAELSWLYRNSLFTVFPSLYEGWGLPVAESLTAGKFCLASNAASIPEVGGDLIEYLDPWDVPLWAERLRYYIENPEFVEQAETLIRKKYTIYTWAEASRDVFSRGTFFLEQGQLDSPSSST